MKNFNSLIRKSNNSVANYGNETATRRQRHGNESLLKRLCVTILTLLTLSIGQMWAGVSGGYIYFDPSQSGWGTPTSVEYIISHDSYSCWYAMSNIANTKLYYISSASWGDAKYIAFTGNYGWTSCEGNSYDSRKGYGPSGSKRTAKSTYGVNSGSTYLFYAANSNNDAAITTSSPAGYLSAGYSALNSTQTINTVVKTGSGSYTAANSKATISITSYEMTGNGTVTKRTPSLSTSASSQTVSAARTATTKLSVGTVASGYQFDGWYTAATGGTQLSSSTTYTYYPIAATTVYARFSEKMSTVTLTASPTGKGTFKIGSTAVTSTTVGVTTTQSVTAVPGTGYNFSSWAVTGGATISSTSTNPTTVTGKGDGAAATLTATFSPKTYTITLDGNGGSDGSATATYNSSTLTSVTGCSRASYDLNGYYTATSGGTKIINADGSLVASVSGYTNSSSQWIKDADVELHAQWTYNPVTYSVTYAVGTGYTSYGSLSAKNTSTSAAIASGSSLESGTGVTFTATPNTGYVVEGWYTNAGCTEGKHDADNNTYSTTLSGNITVYVKFVEKTWTVSFANDGHGTTSPSSNQSVGQLTGVSISATPSTGYTFNTWTISSGSGSFTSSAGTPSNKFKPTANSTITASFNERMSTLTTSCSYDAGKPGYAAPTVSGSATTVGYVTTRTITATTPGTGYTFAGWTLTNCTRTDGGAPTATSITIRSNGDGKAAKVVANYEEDLSSRWHLVGQNVTSKVTFPDGWNINTTSMMQKATAHSTESKVYAEVTVSDASGTYEFKVVDDNGSSADIWYGYSHGDTYLTWTATAENTVYAKDDGGENNNSNNLKFTPTIAGTYKFQVDYSGTYPKVKITYPVSYKLTYSIGNVAGNDGSITTIPSTASGSYLPKDNVITLTAPAAKTGYSWKGWYTNAAGTTGHIEDSNRAITVTMTGTKTLYACYTENDYTVTVAAGEGGSVASTSVTGHIATNVTLPAATANTGYYFTGWTVTTGSATLTNPTSATAAKVNGLTAAATVTANFSPIWYLKGDFNSWGETHPIILSSSTTGSVDLTTVTANISNSKFKIWKKQSNTYYQIANKAITRDAASPTGSWTNGGTGNDMKFNSDVIGTYTFNLTFSTTPTAISITYPTAYTVTFGMGTGGNTVSATATSAGGSFASGNYVASGDVVTFSQTALAGYTFKGWYTTAAGSTSAGVDGSGHLTINDEKTVYAQYTPNTYTVSFNKNGGSGTTPTPITVTYGEPYGPLPAGPTPPGADQFAGWFTTASGEGEHITATTPVSTASDHTLYARFESTFTVTVQYKCGTDVLRAPTTTHASETSVAAEIIAPEILGYAFVNWTGDNASFADATNDTTTVNVTSATTIVANYEEVPMVYFKNNPGWDDVYVTFDCSFSGEVPSLTNKPYYKMSQLGTSDIYYCEIPSTYTASDYASWAWYIAFDNKGTGYNASTHRGTYAFNSGEFIGRKDFDPNATMFIPYVGTSKSLNGGTTYQTGCWLQYNTNYSAYKVRVNTYVQGAGGSEVANIELRSDVAGATEFKAKVYLGNADYTYGVMLYKDYLKNTNDIWYTNVNNEANTITSATTSLPWSWEKCNETWQRCRVKTDVKGDYIFTVSFATGRPMVDIEYPVSKGDFRLVYKDQATWNNTHDASWKQISPVFKHKANRVDTASFFVSYGSNPTLELQKCTNISAGVETWTAQSSVSLGSITSKGVYNFTVTQNNTGTSATAAYLGEYSGKFYVRTDASDGGWNNYKSTANAMTYTEYSMDHGGSSGPYSYYFMRHVNEGQNIKFVVANDYSLCLSDTLIDDTYAHEWVDCEANVRFTYNHTNNEIHRAYISGSSIVSDRFLVLEGDADLFDANGNPLAISGLNPNEMNFIDDQNWIYEATVQAKPNERIKLTAKFNNKIQYFYGAEGERTVATTYQLIQGTGSTKYKMRVVYDFKTNRLVAAWLPNGDINVETPLNADVMIIRYHQQDAQQVTFSGSGKLTDVKTVYGAMEFNKYRLNNQNETAGHGDLGLSPYERDLFFISFPFEVKLNEVFGFGTYGKHWIIEYYDGKTRAANGYWKDSPTNWKFVTKAMKDTFKLKANEGYVLALDLDELTHTSPIWTYGVENVYLYFPSTTTVENIQATSKTVHIDTVGYQCKINRKTPNGDRRVKDSHWHLIGVPSYANANHSTSNSWAESQDDLEQTIYYPNIDPAAWTSAAPFVYDWNARLNKFGVISTSSYSFKPMRSYLVQYARDTLEWRQVNTTVPSSVAARRNAEYKSIYEFRLELQYDGEEADHTFISLRDNDEVTSSFDFNYDLSKELYGAFTPASQVYTITDDNVEAAGNCLPLETEQVTTVPVGIVVKNNGEYTFAMPDGTDGLSVILLDSETGIHTDLSIDRYIVELEAGTYDGRFYISIDPRNAATLIDGVSSEGEDLRTAKIFRNGVLYIQRGEQIYDATGKKVE